MKKVFKRILTAGILTALLFNLLDVSFSFKSYAAKDNYVIAIDPGHGGTGDRNLGAQYNGLSEKDLTMKVATALKEELEKYDNVTVCLTRTTDTIVSLEDRAKYAKSIGADFLFSIHFNASAEHDFYGSEVWTSAFGTNYQKGYDFGQIVSGEWNALGLYQKGVKTKLGSSGKDYYGIIRHSTANGIPCVIMEHAYVDHGYDVAMLKTDGFINKLGVADATAIAKYFKLKSSKTGADYSGYKYNSVKKPSGAVRQDDTDPDVCDIKVLATDPDSGNILVEMTAKDKQSPIIYFSYSYDGGQSFSLLQMWDRTQTTQSFNVKVPSGCKNPTIVCRAYNNYEKFATSTPVTVNTSFK